MRIASAFLLAFFALSAPLVAHADDTCRFAPKYKGQEIIRDKTVRDSFYQSLAKMEARFMKSVGLDKATMMTKDGQPLDVASGLPSDLPPHMFSAPSKECLHLAVIAQFLNGNPVAKAVFETNGANNNGPMSESGYDPATEEVLAILKHKADTYEKFNTLYPGFGGFLPWFAVDGKGGITPTWDWNNKVPSLDNGEWLWAVFAVSEAIRASPDLFPRESALADRYEAIWRRMVKNAHIIFYESPLGLRTVTQMTNQSLPVSQNKYWAAGSSVGMRQSQQRDGSSSVPIPPNVMGYLDDPYEGELFVVAMYLFSEELTAAQKEQLWVAKREMLQKVDLVLDSAKQSVSIEEVSSSSTLRRRRGGSLLNVKKDGPPQRRAASASADETTRITVERGFWYSAHEKWKYLFLPYHKAENNWRVFVNGERARTHYANFVGAKGLWASVNGPITQNGQNGNYYSDCGIQPIAFNNVTHDDIITPYGAFPLFLVREYDHKAENKATAAPAVEAEGIAAAWLHHMISVRQGQNCFGTTEGFNVSGTDVAPLVTWDTKITSLVALMGGNVDIVAKGLDRLGVTDAFVTVVNREWARVFGDAASSGPLSGEDLPILPPNFANAVPTILPDFTSCSESSPACPEL